MDSLSVLLKAQALGVIKPGEVAHVEVAHDTGCPALKRRGCTCEPEIRLIRGGEVITIASDGTVQQEARTQ